MPADGGGGRRFDRRYYAEVSRTGTVRRFGPHWWSQRFFAGRIRRALARAGGRRVLELGCAHGHVLAFLERHAETHGIDLSEHAIAESTRVAPRSRTVVGDVERDLEALYPPESFDVVFAKSLFEHLPRPEDVLRSCRRLLRRRGVLLFSVPNTSSLLRPLKGDRWIGARDPTHVSVLAPEEWADLLHRVGFAVERMYSNGFWDVPYLPLIPNAIQFALFGGPTVLAMLTRGSFLPVRMGENLIVEAVRAD
jgi:SAM-dependent methyltransferase